MSDQKQDEIARILNRWKPDHEDFTSVLEHVFDRDTRIAGHWSVADGHDGASLEFVEASQGFLVRFSTLGCLSEWSLSRTAKLVRGVLVLNSPVLEYCPRKYDRLYPVTSDGYDYLISQADVRAQTEKTDQDVTIDWEHVLKWRAFKHGDVEHPNIWNEVWEKTEQ